MTLWQTVQNLWQKPWMGFCHLFVEGFLVGENGSHLASYITFPCFSTVICVSFPSLNRYPHDLKASQNHHIIWSKAFPLQPTQGTFRNQRCAIETLATNVNPDFFCGCDKERRYPQTRGFSGGIRVPGWFLLKTHYSPVLTSLSHEGIRTMFEIQSPTTERSLALVLDDKRGILSSFFS